MVAYALNTSDNLYCGAYVGFWGEKATKPSNIQTTAGDIRKQGAKLHPFAGSVGLFRITGFILSSNENRSAQKLSVKNQPES